MITRPRSLSSVAAPEDTNAEWESPGATGAEDVEEMEFAAQLLEVTNESELDQFIGNLLQKAARTAGATIPTAVLRPLAHSLKSALKHTLPIVGGTSRALLASGAGKVAAHTAAAADAFGLELEGLGLEDQEFEVARRFVRFARAAGRRAPRFARRASPRAAVRRTLVTAARKYAPGLIRRRRRRRRYVAYPPRIVAVPAPVLYTDPEPILEPDPVPPPEPAVDPDASPAAEPDAEPSGGEPADNTPDTSANADVEPAPEESESAPGTCRCGGRCGKGQRSSSGSWQRDGANIVLRDI